MSKPDLTVRLSLVWIDVQFKRECLASWKFQQDFTRWTLDNDVFAAGRGHNGPLGFSGAYKAKDAGKLLAWLQDEQGIDPS